MTEVTDGGSTYTLRLRRGILFSDDPVFGGRPRELTARDYEFAWKRLIDPKLNALHPKAAPAYEERLSELSKRVSLMTTPAESSVVFAVSNQWSPTDLVVPPVDRWETFPITFDRPVKRVWLNGGNAQGVEVTCSVAKASRTVNVSCKIDKTFRGSRFRVMVYADLAPSE